MTTAYLMDTAAKAGLRTALLDIGDIGWARNATGGGFYDIEDCEIRTLFKLYPWEWLVSEPFGRRIADSARTLWLEPIWKMIWSNKAILPVLWALFPHHPNLLWAGHDAGARRTYVRKPILAREGGNVTIVRDGAIVAATDGPYQGAVVFQDLYDLPVYEGQSPVIGSWIVDGEAAGIGIREDGPVTSNLARFVPHIIE